MRETLSGGHFGFSAANFLKEFRAVEQGLVLARVNKNGCTPAVLRQDDGTFGVLDLPDDGRHVRAKIGKRTNVLNRADTGHGKSGKMHAMMYISSGAEAKLRLPNGTGTQPVHDTDRGLVSSSQPPRNLAFSRRLN
jgi:hypothetical protein